MSFALGKKVFLVRVAILVYYLLRSLSNCEEEAICDGVLLIDLPVRYLHIQFLQNGHNMTTSVGQLSVSILGDCHYRKELLDNNDGSYVLRIRLWSPCQRLNISLISPAGKLLCDSPIIIEKENGELLYPEICDCPRIHLDEWLKVAKCSNHYLQLENDLKQWKLIDFDKVLNKVMTTWGSDRNRLGSALCHYQIINNRIFRRCYGAYTDFRRFVDNMLTSIARKMIIPQTEFVFNLGDYPLQKTELDGVPFISWCGSDDTMDITMPTYELTESVLGALHTVALDIHNVRGQTYWSWNNKKPTAIFRGRDSNLLRLEISLLAKKRPDLVEGGITQYFFFNESLYTPHVEHEPFSNFFKHKFILSIDGTVAAYRLPFLLAGDSIIFKSKSRYYEHFYGFLKQDVHFIPFTSSNIVQKLERAKISDFNQVS